MVKKHSEETKKKMGKVKYGKTRSEETRKKISESLSGENHHRARPISINGLEFETTKNAAEYFSKSKQAIHKWLKSGKYNSFYLDE